jgi:hypothetical protein
MSKSITQEKLNALSALKIAKETGCKVRPKGSVHNTIIWDTETCYFDNFGPQRLYGIGYERLIDANGLPVEWEIIP